MGNKRKHIDIYRKKHKTGREVTYAPDTEKNTETPEKGRRLDKFLVSEDLNIKETNITHTSDHFYKLRLSMEKKFDHGSVRPRPVQIRSVSSQNRCPG